MQSRVGALVLAAIVVASACVGADPSGSPSATEQPSPFATELAPPPSPSPDPSPSPSTAHPPPSTAQGGPVTLRLVADAALEKSLPTQIGPISFVRHSLATGDTPPSGFDDDLGRLLLRAAGSPDGDLAVAWIDPVPEHSASVGGMTVVAVRIRGTEARRLRVLPLIDRMLEPGTTGSFGGTRDEDPPILFGADALTMSAGDDVYIVSYPADDPSATPDPNATEVISLEAIGAAFPGLDPVRLPKPEPPDPTFPPDPGGPPDASLMPAPALEARLPDALRGAPLKKVSAHGASIHDFALVAFPAYALWQGGLDLPLDDLSAAIAISDALSPYSVIAIDTGPHDPRETLAAYFASLAGSRIVEFETVEAGGRTAIFEESGGTGVAATEDTFYWMDYLDYGDCWCTAPPREPVRDLILETLEALP